MRDAPDDGALGCAVDVVASAYCPKRKGSCLDGVGASRHAARFALVRGHTGYDARVPWSASQAIVEPAGAPPIPVRDRPAPPMPGSALWGWIGPLIVTAFGG